MATAKINLDQLSENEIRALFARVGEVFGPENRKAVPLFEDALCYPPEQIEELYCLSEDVVFAGSEEERSEIIARFCALRDSLRPDESKRVRIDLWPEGNMPQNSVYPEKSDRTFNHAADFKPFLVEMLLPETVEPKGAVVVCAGGDHGSCVYNEGYMVGRQLNEQGYQCFILLNRPSGCPWSRQEAAADAARAIRIVRKNAAKYRIPADRVAFAGFSNGGLTGESVIAFCSGEQKLTDHFPDYQPDELDEYYGAPDAFLNVYGPRFFGETFDYTKVVYPPVFLAVGREDGAMRNLSGLCPDLAAHNVPMEVHTFAGVPHGVGGKGSVKGTEDQYPNFQLWVPLADCFMQDVYRKR